MTSFSLNRPLKALYPDAVMHKMRVPTYEFWRDNIVHTQRHL